VVPILAHSSPPPPLDKDDACNENDFDDEFQYMYISLFMSSTNELYECVDA
jgi:hypothetical protein